MRLPIAGLRLLVGIALLPVLVLWLFGGVMVMPPLWVHFYGVGVTAAVAAAAALTLMTMGARRGDARTVVVAGGFAIMAVLLAVHGLVTPGVLVGQNGVVALTGGLTLPIGAAVLALSGLAVFNTRRSIPALLWLVTGCLAAIVVVSLVGVLEPRLVPAVPDARSPEAWALLAIGLVLFGALAIRATSTFLLTRRAADLAVVRRAGASRLLAVRCARADVHGPRLVAGSRLRARRDHARRCVGRLRPPAWEPVPGACRRSASVRSRRCRGSVPRRSRAGDHGAARREGQLDGGAHPSRRCACGRGRREPRALRRKAARPRDRRPAARCRQALRPELDPAEAWAAPRRRIRGREATPAAWP